VIVIEISNTKIYDLEESMIASGYPMETKIETNFHPHKDVIRSFKLANNLPGTGHPNFLSGIIVSFDLTAPQYFWMQFERYHFTQIISSQSKMHRILKMDINKQVNKYVDKRIIDILKDYIKDYNTLNDELSKEGKEYRKKHEDSLKKMFQLIVSNTPMGLELTARISTNYLQLKTQYLQRRKHKLEEWQYYCDWIESLPFCELITNN
jgi:hypothetical protein